MKCTTYRWDIFFTTVTVSGNVIAVHCALAMCPIMASKIAPGLHEKIQSTCTVNCCKLICTGARNAHVGYFVRAHASVCALVQCITFPWDVPSHDYDLNAVHVVWKGEIWYDRSSFSLKFLTYLSNLVSAIFGSRSQGDHASIDVKTGRNRRAEIWIKKTMKICSTWGVIQFGMDCCIKFTRFLKAEEIEIIAI